MFFAPAIRGDSLFTPILPDPGFERFMGDTLRGVGGLGMEEDDKAWTVSMDLPGVPREQLSVSIAGRGVRVETTGDAKREYKAAYELPGEIDVDASEARLENGVLSLRLAKAELKSRRQITVN